MIDSIIGSLTSFLWCMIVLGMLFYLFGISMTSGVHEYLSGLTQSSQDATVVLLQDYFGTLDRSMMSLLMAMSGGRDWGEFYDALQYLSLLYRTVFVLFVSFSVFAV